MSRSNNTEITNPATKFFEWDAVSGKLKYFDKSKGEKGEKVSVELPFTFLALDTLHTIRGYSDSDQSGYWANEVRDIKKESLSVRTKKGHCVSGLYDNIIESRSITGARYCQSVYIAYKEGGKLVIAHLSVMGAALGSWIEFRKKNKIFEGAVSIKSFTEGKKGATTFKVPVFSFGPVSKETNEEAIALDKQLQDYLTDYFKIKGQQTQETATEQVIAKDPEVSGIIAEATTVNASLPTLDQVDDLPF